MQAAKFCTMTSNSTTSIQLRRRQTRLLVLKHWLGCESSASNLSLRSELTQRPLQDCDSSSFPFSIITVSFCTLAMSMGKLHNRSEYTAKHIIQGIHITMV